MMERTLGNAAGPLVHTFDMVESVAQSYLEAEHVSGPPSIVEYLGKAKEALQPALLRNLLQIDIERRRLKGEQPQVSDYVTWIPEHESLIRLDFLESNSEHRSQSVLAETAAVYERSHSPRRPVASRLGEYHLLRELGRAGMEVVFEAVHSIRQERIALASRLVVPTYPVFAPIRRSGSADLRQSLASGIEIRGAGCERARG